MSDAPYLQTCEACGMGYYTTYMTRRLEESKLRAKYLSCNACDHKPEKNKMIVPLSDAPIQASRNPSGMKK